MDIKALLQHQIETWEPVGVPALVERFVLRNGQLYKGAAFAGKRMPPKQCFANATRWMLANGGTYVEGFAWRSSLPFAVHHAWVVKGDAVIDPTWVDPEHCEYFGVPVLRHELHAVLAKTGYYGVLDYGRINLDFLFERDPALQQTLEEFATSVGALKNDDGHRNSETDRNPLRANRHGG